VRIQLLAFVAALAGTGISIYLTVVHYSAIPLACPANDVINCEQVLSSPDAVIGARGRRWRTLSSRGRRSGS